MEDLHHKRVTVMGLGTFGGGAAAVRFLLQRGAHVTIADLRSGTQLADSLAQLPTNSRLTLHLGGHVEHDFTDCDLVVANPAVPPENCFLNIARERGIPITTEIALFWEQNPSRVIAVTGSNGKSTTAAMTHAILQAAGRRVHLGGNIGGSLLEKLPEITADDWTVLELSSFQLHYLDALRAAPDVAVVTNFSPNHLNWHGSLAHYRRSKQAILRWQTPDQTAVLSAGDADVHDWPTRAVRRLFAPDEPSAWPISQWLSVPGRHNELNARAAALAASVAGISAEAVQQGLSDFRGLPHRLEFVAEIAGRRFYNDSLATTPESAIAALEAFDAPVVLLAGGSDKGVALDDFAAAIEHRCKAVALLGETAATLDSLLRQTPRLRANSLTEAFAWACEVSNPGDVVLLSPGCASYDWFRDFRERGEQFTHLVEQYAAGQARVA